jgi:hypothetical protein
MSERSRGTGRLREPGTRGATRRAQPDGCGRPPAREGGCGCIKDIRGRGTGGSGAARLSWRRMRWEDQDAMSTDLTVILEHRPGELARLGEITGEAGVSIRGLAAFTGEGRGVVHVLLDDDAVASCRAALKRAAIGIADEREVLVVEIEDRPMALGELTRQLADANVNVDLAYTTFGRVKIVIATDDLKSARAVLQQT